VGYDLLKPAFVSAEHLLPMSPVYTPAGEGLSGGQTGDQGIACLLTQVRQG
jgi:hypothetical protein